MARTRTADSKGLERQLLRKSIGLMSEGSPRCCDCRRTPLTGERVHIYGRGVVVCALCRHGHRDEPVRTELILGIEHGHTVQPITVRRLT